MWILIAVLGLLLGGLIVVSFLVQYRSTKRAKVSRLDTGQGRPKRNTKVLWGLIGVSVVYSGLLRSLRTLTGIPLLDGGIGVALGLYICAHPAANAVNMLFFERDTLRQISDWSVIRWLALNLLVLLAGWMVIFVGLTRLVDRAA